MSLPRSTTRSSLLPSLILLLLLHLTNVLAVFQPCPFLGPDFPSPTSLSTSPIMASALQNLTLALDQVVRTNNDGYEPLATLTPSLSISIFSTDNSSRDSLYQYHYTAPAVANSTSGVHVVDENSIYRIGSISKMFTVYTFLLELGDGYWNQPVTKYVPELAAAAKDDVITQVQWEDVTLGDLAGQMAGIDREYFGDYASQSVELTQVGFPPLNNSEEPSCTLTQPCDRAGFFAGISKLNPVFLPSTTPTYSNLAYGLLAYALESITNKSFDTMLNDRVFTPLQMTHSSLFTPLNSTNGVIPVSINASGWTTPTGNEAPAGNIYSSLADMTKAGRSILSSSLLTPAQTRRWLKPGTHTADLYTSVGMPWEIYRVITQPSNRIVDIYTKDGSIGGYGSILVLSPDYQVGFVVLSAAVGGSSPEGVAAMIINTLLPALENTARTQTQASFAGQYQTTAINSSIIISANDDLPGMTITSWISNGTDFRAAVATNLLDFPESSLSLRVYPTNLVATSSSTSTASGSQSRRVAFRIVSELNTTPRSTSFFPNSCQTWGGVDVFNYGGAALDELVFNMDINGNVESVEVPALRITLDKAK